jgi:hypothetical protein
VVAICVRPVLQLVFAVVILAGLLSGPAALEAGPVAYVLSNNTLIAIDTASPGTPGAPVAVTGLIAGDVLVGIDFRPQNGFLYELGFNSATGTVTVYHVSHRTGQATAVGNPAAFVQADGVTPAPVQGVGFGSTSTRPSIGFASSPTPGRTSASIPTPGRLSTVTLAPPESRWTGQSAERCRPSTPPRTPTTSRTRQ